MPPAARRSSKSPARSPARRAKSPARSPAKSPKSGGAKKLPPPEPLTWATGLRASFDRATNVLSTRSAFPPHSRAILSRPLSAYGLSPLAYTLVGVFTVIQNIYCPGALPFWPPRYAVPEAAFVVLQSSFSFMSDVVHIGHTSLWHPVDRNCALLLTAAQVLKFFVLMPRAAPLWACAAVWCGIVVGLACKIRATAASRAADFAGFARWHTLWHWCLPLTIGGYTAVAWQTYARSSVGLLPASVLGR